MDRPAVDLADKDPTLQTRLNGQTVQSAHASQMIFGIAEIIAYCSRWTPLRPGDLIATGTPGGVGSRREPPLWMKAGDHIEVEVVGLGVLETTWSTNRDGRGIPLAREREHRRCTRARDLRR